MNRNAIAGPWRLTGVPHGRGDEPAKENGGAMVSAVTLRSKLMGLIIEKRQSVPNPFDDVPIAELEAADAAMTAIKNARSVDGSSARAAPR